MLLNVKIPKLQTGASSEQILLGQSESELLLSYAIHLSWIVVGAQIHQMKDLNQTRYDMSKHGSWKWWKPNKKTRMKSQAANKLYT